MDRSRDAASIELQPSFGEVKQAVVRRKQKGGSLRRGLLARNASLAAAETEAPKLQPGYTRFRDGCGLCACVRVCVCV